MRLTGEMQNSGGGVTYFNKAVFYIQRPDGRAADCSFTYVTGTPVRLSSGVTTSTGLLAGQSAPYDDFTDAPTDAASITGWTLWDEGGATPADERVLLAAAAEASGSGDRAQAFAFQREVEARRHARDRLFRGGR